MKTIYLHIGSEKTGTSSIQNFAVDNRNNLLKQGVLVPNFLRTNNIELTCYALDEHNFNDPLRLMCKIKNKKDLIFFRKTLFSNFKTIFKKNKNVKSLFLSNEHLSSRLKTIEELTFLKTFLNSFSQNIKIIIYFRRQDEFILSHYSTAIRSGRTHNFEIPKKTPRLLQYNYLAKLWGNVFGINNIIFRVFEREQLLQNDVIDDMFDIMDVKITKEFKRKTPTNQSLSPEALVLLRELNIYFPRIIDNNFNPLRNGLVDTVDLALPINKLKLSDFNEAERFNYYKTFTKSNIFFAKKFLDRDYLFLADKKSSNQTNSHFENDLDINTYQVGRKKIIRTLCAMWSNQQEKHF